MALKQVHAKDNQMIGVVANQENERIARLWQNELERTRNEPQKMKRWAVASDFRFMSNTWMDEVESLWLFHDLMNNATFQYNDILEYIYIYIAVL